MKRTVSIFGKKMRPAFLILAGLLALVALSAIFEGPRTVYAHAIII